MHETIATDSVPLDFHVDREVATVVTMVELPSGEVLKLQATVTDPTFGGINDHIVQAPDGTKITYEIHWPNNLMQAVDGPR
jgi:hypothetical protein